MITKSAQESVLELEGLIGRLAPGDEALILGPKSPSEPLKSRYRTLVEARELWCRLRADDVRDSLGASGSLEAFVNTLDWDENLFPQEARSDSIDLWGFDLRIWAVEVIRDSLGVPRSVEHEIEVPVAIVETGIGIPLSLRFELIENGSGEIFPSVGQYLGGLCKGSFNRSLRTAMSLSVSKTGVADKDVRWSLLQLDESSIYPRLIDGESAGAAALYGLLRLLRGERPDEGVLVLGACSDSQKLEKVEGLNQKIEGWCRYLEPRRTGKEPWSICLNTVFVAGANADEIDIPSGWSNRLWIESVSNVDHLDSKRSNLVRRIREYLDGLDSLDDLRDGSQRTLSQVAVRPRVWKRVPRGNRHNRTGGKCLGLPVASLGLSGGDALVEQKLDNNTDDVRELVRWERESEAVKRGVVTGIPGAGKSVLAKVQVIESSIGFRALLTERRLPLNSACFPVWIHLPDLSKVNDSPLSDLPFFEWVNAGVRGNDDDPKSVLNYFNVLIVCDSLDEAGDETRKIIRRFLEHTGKTRARILVTCRKEDWVRRREWVHWRSDELVEYELADFNVTERQKLIRNWFGKESDSTRKLELRIGPEGILSHAMRTPLILNCLCQLSAESSLPKSFKLCDIYSAMIGLILGRSREGVQLKPEEIDEVVSQLKNGLLRFEDGEWRGWFKGNARMNQIDSTQLVSSLNGERLMVEKLVELGLLIRSQFRGGGGHSYSFVHRTFLEALVGEVVASVATESREGERVVLDLLDKKSWHTGWQHAVLVLVGRVGDPWPYLGLLMNSKADDLLRTRFWLAVRCLGEVEEYSRASPGHDMIVDRFLVGPWRERMDEDDLVPDPEELPLKAISSVDILLFDVVEEMAADVRNGSWMTGQSIRQLRKLAKLMPVRTVLVSLVDLLDCENQKVRESVIKALGNAGGSAAEAYVVGPLVDLLKDGDHRIRFKASESLGEIGRFAADLACFDRLIARLRTESAVFRRHAATALGKMGEVAATTTIIEALCELLKDDDLRVRGAAVEAIGEIGATAAQAIVLDAVVGLIGDEPDMISMMVCSTISSLGESAGTPEILAALTRLLNGQDHKMCVLAANAINDIGKTPGQLDITDALVRIAQNENANIREAVAEALGRIGNAALETGAVEALFRLLKDESRSVQQDSLDALCEIYRETSESSILDGLMRELGDMSAMNQLSLARHFLTNNSGTTSSELTIDMVLNHLSHEESFVRLYAAEIVFELDMDQTHRAAVQTLIELLRDDDELVRYQASFSFDRLESQSVHPNHLNELLELMNDDNTEKRVAAVNALSGLGARAATDGVVTALVNLMEDSQKEVQISSIRALGMMGERAASKDVLERLSELLNDETMRHNVAEALRELSPIIRGRERIAAVFGSYNGAMDEADIASLSLALEWRHRPYAESGTVCELSGEA